MNNENVDKLVEKAMETQHELDIIRALAASSNDPEYQNSVVDEIERDYIKGGEDEALSEIF